jgi:hypothetical protein
LNVLDENVPRDQADLLKGWGIPFRSIARDLGYQGIQDSEVLPLLLRLKKPTLLTRDSDFFRRNLAHRAYSLVWFDMPAEQTAFFIRRFLRHANFKQNSQRLGKVIRVLARHIEYWQKNSEALVAVQWQQ